MNLENVGEGYLVRPIPLGDPSGTYTTNYTLGTLNNGVVNFTAIFGDDQNDSPNVLSNPYASAIDADLFITDNALVDKVYFWEHITSPNPSYPGYQAANYDMGDISIRNSGGGVAAANGGGAPGQYIPSGQGFAIKATGAGTITFNNSLRVTGNNTGYRNSEITIDRLYLEVINETYHLKSNTLIAFTDGATNGFDPNYDAKRLATPVSLYSLNSDRELAIQGRAAFNEDHIIPLGFTTHVEEDQQYTISVSSLEGELISDSNIMIYLEDTLLGIVTNLSDTDYTFNSYAGHQTDRFIIYFEERQVLGNSDSSLESVSLYPNPTQNILHIISPNTDIINVDVYDVRGRKVNSVDFNDQATYQIDMSALESAMYFVKINTENGSITKRVVKE